MLKARRSILRRRAAAAAALLLLGACAGEGRHDFRETFEQTVALPAGGSFALENVNGAIRVNTWEREETRIRAEKRAGSEQALEKIKIHIRTEDGRVSVRTELPPSPWLFGNGGGVVGYEATIPQSARARIETVNGQVEIDGVRGRLRAKSVNGSIRVRGAASAVSASTVNGPIEVFYALLAGGEQHEFSTVNGPVALQLARRASAAFDVHTVNGSIETDLPLHIEKGKWSGPQRVEGRLGDAPEPARFRVHTVNGKVTILESKAPAPPVEPAEPEEKPDEAWPVSPDPDSEV